MQRGPGSQDPPFGETNVAYMYVNALQFSTKYNDP